MAQRIAFIDIDRVLANGDARFALAEKAKQEVLTVTGDRREATNAYWRTAFTPEHIALDTPIDGAPDAINKISADYDIILLTSRPEHLRTATTEWLKNHNLIWYTDMVMKPAVNQYHKTREWKVWMVHALAGMYNASDVLVIDNEEANLDELAKVPAPFKMRVYTSLEMKEAVEPVLPDDDDHLF